MLDTGIDTNIDKIMSDFNRKVKSADDAELISMYYRIDEKLNNFFISGYFAELYTKQKQTLTTELKARRLKDGY